MNIHGWHAWLFWLANSRRVFHVTREKPWLPNHELHPYTCPNQFIMVNFWQWQIHILRIEWTGSSGSHFMGSSCKLWSEFLMLAFSCTNLYVLQIRETPSDISNSLYWCVHPCMSVKHSVSSLSEWTYNDLSVDIVWTVVFQCRSWVKGTLLGCFWDNKV